MRPGICIFNQLLWWLLCGLNVESHCHQDKVPVPYWSTQSPPGQAHVDPMVSPILIPVFQPRWMISPRELGSGCLWRSSPQELCWCPHWTLGPVWGSLGFGGIGIHSMGLRTRALELVRPGALPHARAAMQLWTAGQPPWENHFLPCKMEALIQSSPWLVLRTQWGYWTRELLRPETDTEQDSVSGYDWGWWHLPETLPECLQHQGCWC